MASLKRIKQINSWSGHARFLAECDHTDDGKDVAVVGYLARVQTEDIASPYAYSPSKVIYRHNGRKVVLFETRHRHIEVFEVSPQLLTFKTDEAATDWHIRFSRKS